MTNLEIGLVEIGIVEIGLGIIILSYFLYNVLLIKIKLQEINQSKERFKKLQQECTEIIGSLGNDLKLLEYTSENIILQKEFKENYEKGNN